MTGWFQRDMLHSTIPANDWRACWATGTPAEKRCRVMPTQVRPRINLTGRHVRNHAPGCPASGCPAPVELDASAHADAEELPAAAPIADTVRLQEEIKRLHGEIDWRRAAELNYIQQVRDLESEARARQEQSRDAELKYLDQIASMQTDLLQREEEEASAKAARLTEKAEGSRPRGGEASELPNPGQHRAEALRLAAKCFHAELEFNVASMWDKIRRFTLVERIEASDQLFLTGFNRPSRLHRVLMPWKAP